MNVSVVEIDVSYDTCSRLVDTVGLLSNLRSLILYDCQLTGIATQLGLLNSLTSLSLGRNRELFTLPTEIGQMANLRRLDLGENGLVFLPTEVGRLSKLTTLNLANMFNLDGHAFTIPTQVGLLSELVGMDLSQNSLLGLPTELGKLIRLTDLDLAEAEYPFLPTQIGQLSGLGELDLHDVESTSLPTQLGQLTLLSSLHCQILPLVGLPTQVGELTLLQRLVLEHTSELSTLPTQLFQLKHLSLLQIVSKKVSALPAQIGLLTNLTSLKLSLPIKELPTNIGLLTKMTSLTLEFVNNLTFVSSDIGMLTKLEVLQVSWARKLQSVPTQLGKLTALSSVELTGTGISSLPTQVGQLSKVTVLRLMSNSELFTLPTELGKLSKSATYYLGGSSVTTLSFEHFDLSAFQDLDPPSNLEPLVVTSDTIEVSWDAPKRCENFHPLGYKIIVEMVGYMGRKSSTTSGILQKTLELGQLFPATSVQGEKFSIRVQAITSGSTCSLFSRAVTVQTCSKYMQRNRLAFDDCFALAGYFKMDGEAVSCADLEKNLTSGALDSRKCFQNEGTTVQNLAISVNFWRASILSNDIRLCPRFEFCSHYYRNFTEREIGETSPDQYCAENHTGIYCSGCIEDNALRGQTCEYCKKEERESIAGILILVTMFTLLLISLYAYVLWKAGCFRTCFNSISLKCKSHCCGQRPSESLSQNLKQRVDKPRSKSSKAGSKARLMRCLKGSLRFAICTWNYGVRLVKIVAANVMTTRVRILFGYFQVLAAYRRILPLRTGSETTSLLSVMTFISNIDFTLLLTGATSRCSMQYSHYDILLAATLGPIAMTVLLFTLTLGTAYCLTRELLDTIRRKTISALLFFMFTVYPYVSHTILATFWCEQFPCNDTTCNLTTSALREDYTLSCDPEFDAQRSFFEEYAKAMVLIYPVGVVVLYVSLLFFYYSLILEDSRKKIEDKKDKADVERKTKLATVSFLIEPYTNRRFWFEAYELLRKLLQTAVIGYFAGVPNQSVSLLSQNLTVAFIVILLLLSPYKDGADLAYAVFSLALLLPATQSIIMNPRGRHDATFEALAIIEVVVLVLFAIFPVCRSTAKRAITFKPKRL